MDRRVGSAETDLNETAYPRYSFPPRNVAGLVWDWAPARRRSFREDALAAVGRLKPSLHRFGEEHVPQLGPCVIAFNHYHRENFNAIWLAAAIAATVPRDIHFVMTGELTYPGRWYAPFGRFFSKIVLRRIARVYGFTTMPPMPPRPKDVQARAESVRRVLDFARRTENPIIGLAPEGGDSPDGALARPAWGAGRFGLLLAAAGLAFVPAGMYEEGGEFCLRFGPAYELSVAPGLSPDEKDRAAATVIMQNIARLLPERMRGQFGD
ncbi:MAG: 1-acyl-sn-glycerol-3-phosphate acyltransferase [Chloroflexota bacterium]